MFFFTIVMKTRLADQVTHCNLASFMIHTRQKPYKRDTFNKTFTHLRRNQSYILSHAINHINVALVGRWSLTLMVTHSASLKIHIFVSGLSITTNKCGNSKAAICVRPSCKKADPGIFPQCISLAARDLPDEALKNWLHMSQYVVFALAKTVY